MNKNQKFIIQCINCGNKHKRTIKWLENAHHLACDGCDIELDVDEVVNDIDNNARRAVYKAYPK